MRPSPPGTVFRPSASNQPGMSSACIEFRIDVCSHAGVGQHPLGGAVRTRVQEDGIGAGRANER